MPNSNRPLMNTWHGSLSINSDAGSNDSGFIEMTFDIDRVQSGNFSHSPKGTGNDYNFNNVVFVSQATVPAKPQSHDSQRIRGRADVSGYLGFDHLHDVASASQTPIKPPPQEAPSNNSPRGLELVLLETCQDMSESRVVRIHSRTSAIRRQYIQQELRVVQEQFVDIDELERMHGGSAEDIRMQLDGARERNNQLLTRIQELEAELQSAWALGLSDEPPPGYSSARESLT
ncbi:hypothetical protein B0H14DRAFT_3132234 [Mycena olivaceomarginata]|nr:hypothetical protein B0H14DRAFT_3132234 [Mycena olivaceomarginata]